VSNRLLTQVGQEAALLDEQDKSLARYEALLQNR
jgi:hypothetical protein